MRITVKADQELIQAATSIIQRNYVPGKHHVGAAIRGRSGRIFAGVQLESTALDICAEAVAVGIGASSGEREFDCIVAETMAERQEPRVISPCGVCRELIRFYCSSIEVIFIEDGDLRKCRVGDLLPAPYVNS